MTDDRRRTAFHEASHALAARLLGFDVSTASIRKGEHLLGVVTYERPAVSDFTERIERRRGHSLLGLNGLRPVPLFGEEARRSGESLIMIRQAGRLGEEFVGSPPEPGYVDDFDDREALRIATELTNQQTAELDAIYAETDIPSDDTTANQVARYIAGERGAAALVAWLRHETARLVFSGLFSRLLPPIAELLLRNESIPGQAVHAVVERETERIGATESIDFRRAARLARMNEEDE